MSLCLLSVVALLGGTSAAEVKPLITTDVIFGTAALIGDVYGQLKDELVLKIEPVYTEVLEKGFKSIGIADKNLLKAFELKTGVKEDLIRGHHTMLWEKIAAAHEMHEQLTLPLRNKFYSAAMERTISFIDAFETLLPKYKGFIKRTPGDCFLFLAYIVTVVYVSARIALAVLFLSLGIFRFVVCCPCRMCRSSGGAAPAKKGKTNSKPKAKAEPTPVPKGNKKK